MSRPRAITVHCSATENKDSVNVDLIRRWHKAKGWSDIGYHYVITTNGEVEIGRPDTRNGAHVKGHNIGNIGICLIGGVDKNGKSEDNFNGYQLEALRLLIINLIGQYGIREDRLMGHRDYPGVAKDCPCFDVRQWWQQVTR